MTEFIQPFDLQAILIDNFAGTEVIFVFIAIVVFAILAARFRMPNIVSMILLSLFAIIMQGYMMFNSLYLVVIIFSGIVVIYWIGRLIKY